MFRSRADIPPIQSSKTAKDCSSPPLESCFFFHIKNSSEEIRKILKLDSLHFLSLDGLYHSMGHKKRDTNNPQYTDHCFTGDYPTKLIDRDEGALENQLSLLNDK